MGTRQVYVNSSTTRRRIPLALNHDMEYSDYYDFNEGQNRAGCSRSYVTGTANNVNSPHPTANQLRNARLDRFETSYELDKEQFKAKEEEKKRKKLEEKLKRYQNVGELGQKLTDCDVTQRDKSDGLRRSRDRFYHQNVNIVQNRENELIKSMECLKIQPEIEDSNNESTGGRLGGRNITRARGEHPLLAKLSQTNKQPQDSESL